MRRFFFHQDFIILLWNGVTICVYTQYETQKTFWIRMQFFPALNFLLFCDQILWRYIFSLQECELKHIQSHKQETTIEKVQLPVQYVIVAFSFEFLLLMTRHFLTDSCNTYHKIQLCYHLLRSHHFPYSSSTDNSSLMVNTQMQHILELLHISCNS